MPCAFIRDMLTLIYRGAICHIMLPADDDRVARAHPRCAYFAMLFAALPPASARCRFRHTCLLDIDIRFRYCSCLWSFCRCARSLILPDACWLLLPYLLRDVLLSRFAFWCHVHYCYMLLFAHMFVAFVCLSLWRACSFFRVDWFSGAVYARCYCRRYRADLRCSLCWRCFVWAVCQRCYAMLTYYFSFQDIALFAMLSRATWRGAMILSPAGSAQVYIDIAALCYAYLIARYARLRRAERHASYARYRAPLADMRWYALVAMPGDVWFRQRVAAPRVDWAILRDMPCHTSYFARLRAFYEVAHSFMISFRWWCPWYTLRVRDDA